MSSANAEMQFIFSGGNHQSAMNENLPSRDLPTNQYLSQNWNALVWTSVFLILTSLLQYYLPYPVDDDTAYHFAVGQLIRKYGILHDFPWTPFSWQFNHYADKEFFFHLLFVPLGGLGFDTAQRVVGVVAGTAILTALYFVLRIERVKLAGVWAVLPLASSAFVFRFAQVRPHLLSIALAIVLLWAVARQRLAILAIVAVIYPLTYVAFWQIPLILIVAAESARFLSGERIGWKPTVTVIAGIALGVVLHPNTVNLLGINWIHMSDILYKNAWGRKTALFNLGNEFRAYSITEWGKFLVLTVLLTGTAVVMAWRERRKCSLSLAFSIAAVIFGLITIRTCRFLEYFIPFSVLALAVATRTMEKKFIAPALLGISLIYMFSVGTDPYKVMTALESRTGYLEPNIANHFAQQIPEGSQVFTCGWDYTGTLMVALPERSFIVAADPTLFYKKNPSLYYVWYSLPFFAPPDTVETIRKQFKSRFVICRNYYVYTSFFHRLSSDSSVKRLFANERWVLFDLGEPER